MIRLLRRVRSSFGKRSPYRSPFRRHAAGHSALSDRTERRRSPYRTVCTATSVVAVAAFFGLLARMVAGRFARLEVDGVSMIPTFAPGDRVLVLKTRDVSVGDVVAIEDPQAAQRVLVKRVVGIDRSVVRVEGDNAAASRDSRDFGPVLRTAVIGRVVTRYHSPRRYSPERP